MVTTAAGGLAAKPPLMIVVVEERVFPLTIPIDQQGGGESLRHVFADVLFGHQSQPEAGAFEVRSSHRRHGSRPFDRHRLRDSTPLSSCLENDTADHNTNDPTHSRQMGTAEPRSAE
jgi:hypothetical protein